MPERADRRRFLRAAGGALGGIALASRPLRARAATGLPGHPARFYKKLPLKRVECQLCPKLCRVDDTERGFCGVRENVGGEYRTLVYGRACAMNVDPIEKKPLFHFLPGAWTFSIATAGCNMDCKACQNWQISQSRPEQVRSYDLPPEKLCQAALRAGSRIVTYTYTEPVVFLEYVIDSARAGRRLGLRNCMVTSGNVEVAPLKEACAVLDAVKVDLKSFSEDTYLKQCKGHLKPILRTLETIRKLGRWLEIVYLVDPDHQRQREGGPGHEPLGQGHARPRGPAPPHALSPRLPAQAPPAHALLDAEAMPRDRGRRGDPLRLRRQPPRPRRRGHPLSEVQEDADRAGRLQCPLEPASRRQVPGLRHRDPGILALTFQLRPCRRKIRPGPKICPPDLGVLGVDDPFHRRERSMRADQAIKRTEEKAEQQSPSSVQTQALVVRLAGEGKRVLKLEPGPGARARAPRAAMSDRRGRVRPRAVHALRRHCSAVIRGSLREIHLPQYLHDRRFDVVVVRSLLAQDTPTDPVFPSFAGWWSTSSPMAS